MTMLLTDPRGPMKLTLESHVPTFSLERRLSLAGAQPVTSYLMPQREFVPADLLIWWQLRPGQETTDHVFSIYAWPEDRRSALSAYWCHGILRDPVPAWIDALSETVHTDLVTNSTGARIEGAADRWGYGADRRWTIEGAPALDSTHDEREPFTPSSLNIWHSYSPGSPAGENRYRITARQDERASSLSADWGGSTSYSDDIPVWIQELADAQRQELIAVAAAHESDRISR
ncbi:hypothetical protein [Arthrobacter sp. A2-55]|uniref:hypothetical protein n=1 Tax=Arthrobacter sp. A2-55 TaxID=2897337 RepID=UPI0021CD5226|nr:hypothetical protein [Arthrobacter sp. A2-55]MCU6481322.1 hypothetical protein [Arthrobacter sp. A2-55]